MSIERVAERDVAGQVATLEAVLDKIKVLLT
jgi:hypothetical protein